MTIQRDLIRRDLRELLVLLVVVVCAAAGCDPEPAEPGAGEPAACPDVCELGTWHCVVDLQARRCVEDDDGCPALEEAVACEDESECTEDLCDPAAGCVRVPIVFDDGDVCNGLEGCDPIAGPIAGTPLECSDGLDCNGQEWCHALEGCIGGVPLESCCSDDGECDDGNPCNGGGQCDLATGQCLLVPPPSCDDGNLCNGVEFCDAEIGGCAGGTALVCDDGNACNGLELCAGEGGCQPGIPLVCDDGLPCNGLEHCEGEVGCVIGAPLAGCCFGLEDCEDGNVCNGLGSCDAETETCHVEAPVACEDGDACNGIQVCTLADGCTLVLDPPTCEDGNPCNGAAGCEPALGCTPGSPPACDDDDLCNGLEVCDPDSGCIPSTQPPVCTDGNPCNGVELCDGSLGCEVGSLPQCDDGDACNGIETCDPAAGGCTSGATLDCDDDDASTDDACDPTLGCVHEDNGCGLVVEVCNGLDDDCDGATDETFPAEGEPCGTSLCPGGTMICLAGGAGPACSSAVGSTGDADSDGIPDACDPCGLGWILAADPVAYWRFDEEAGGSAVFDHSGSGNDLYLGADAQLGAAGVAADGDAALYLPGLTLESYAMVEGFEDFGGDELTISMWFRPDDVADYDTLFEGLFDYNLDGEPPVANLLRLGIQDGALQFKTETVNIVPTGQAISAGAWHHLAITWDAEAGLLASALDGAVYVETLVPHAIDTGGWLLFGNEMDTPLPGLALSSAFLGHLDEVALFDRVLSIAELEVLRQATVCE